MSLDNGLGRGVVLGTLRLAPPRGTLVRAAPPARPPKPAARLGGALAGASLLAGAGCSQPTATEAAPPRELAAVEAPDAMRAHLVAERKIVHHSAGFASAGRWFGYEQARDAQQFAIVLRVDLAGRPSFARRSPRGPVRRRPNATSGRPASARGFAPTPRAPLPCTSKAAGTFSRP